MQCERGDRAPDRRTFLTTSLVAGAGALVGCTGSAPGAAGGDPQPGAPPFRISLAQWSLHQRLRATGPQGIDNLEFAATARTLGFGAIEYVNQFFMDRAADRAYLAEMVRRADDAGVRSLLIMCDGLGHLGDPDRARRSAAIAAHDPWLDAASTLGCHSIRVNAQSAGSRDEQLQRAADGLRRLTERAARQDLNVLVENHGGLSSDGSWLAAVMREVGHERCGTLPDFGNFRIADGRFYDPYQGVAELMPFAKAVSAKSHDFDARGNETRIDYPRMMAIVLAAGYHGYVGVEYEGERLAEADGIVATRELLERIATGRA